MKNHNLYPSIELLEEPIEHAGISMLSHIVCVEGWMIQAVITALEDEIGDDRIKFTQIEYGSDDMHKAWGHFVGD